MKKSLPVYTHWNVLATNIFSLTRLMWFVTDINLFTAPLLYRVHVANAMKLNILKNSVGETGWRLVRFLFVYHWPATSFVIGLKLLCLRYLAAAACDAKWCEIFPELEEYSINKWFDVARGRRFRARRGAAVARDPPRSPAVRARKRTNDPHSRAYDIKRELSRNTRPKIRPINLITPTKLQYRIPIVLV